MATLKENMGSNPVMAWAHAGRFVEIRKVFSAEKDRMKPERVGCLHSMFHHVIRRHW